MKSKSARSRPLLLVLLGLVAVETLLAALAWRQGAGKVARLEMHDPIRVGEHEVNLFALADWGDDNEVAENVARSMARLEAGPVRADAVLLAGDNYYGSAKDSDSAWRAMFEQRFDPARFPMPFYAILGNHDYGAAVDEAELDFSRTHPAGRWKMPGRWYRLDLPAERPLVTVLMLDSNHERLTTEQWIAQKQWIAEQLARPRDTKWLIVCAHHPLYSNGDHGDDTFLQEQWGDWLAAAGVDLYVCGHDHDMQHLLIPGVATDFVVCGGGGAGVRAIERFDRGPFAKGTNGFVHLRIGDLAAEVRMLDDRGNVLHTFGMKPGQHTVTTTAAAMN